MYIQLLITKKYSIMKKILYLLVISSLLNFGIKTDARAANIYVVVPEINPSVSTHPTLNIGKLVHEFRSLSRAERRERIREVKRELRHFNKEKRAGRARETNMVLLVILAILLPPLAVYLYEGEINNKFWISLILTLLFFLPGIIYALLVITGSV